MYAGRNFDDQEADISWTQWLPIGIAVLMLLFSFQGERQWERVVANLPMVYYVNST
jgi:hypothetical protein